jgi:hypothetical protein
MLTFALAIFSLSVGDTLLPSEFARGHAVVPIVHSSDEIHDFFAVDDTLLFEPRSALVGEHSPPVFDSLVTLKQPTEEGALERDKDFKAAARKAWSWVSHGEFQQEAGFMVDRAGKMSGVQLGKEIGQSETVGSTVFHVSPEGIFANLHTHPRPILNKKWVQQPSQADIDVAKDNQQNVYVVTSSGLWQVEPDGTVNHVFATNNWMSKKNN